MPDNRLALPLVTDEVLRQKNEDLSNEFKAKVLELLGPCLEGALEQEVWLSLSKEVIQVAMTSLVNDNPYACHTFYGIGFAIGGVIAQYDEEYRKGLLDCLLDGLGASYNAVIDDLDPTNVAGRA